MIMFIVEIGVMKVLWKIAAIHILLSNWFVTASYDKDSSCFKHFFIWHVIGLSLSYLNWTRKGESSKFTIGLPKLDILFLKGSQKSDIIEYGLVGI